MFGSVFVVLIFGTALYWFESYCAPSESERGRGRRMWREGEMERGRARGWESGGRESGRTGERERGREGENNNKRENYRERRTALNGGPVK